MSQMKGNALSGLRVLDFTQFLSGPFGTQILADLGADIIKIEGPQGDLTRHMPPNFVGDDSVYYLSVNRNKRSIVVDLKTQEGIDIVRRLVGASDVVIENFRPGVLERLGLVADTLLAEKPSLIWCSISGFGQSGPYRDKPAYDMVVQAISGGMSLTGEPDGNSVRAGIPIADLAAGMYAVIAILAALRRRDSCGRGEVIDISMLDCQAAMLCYQGAYFLQSGKIPPRQGRAHDSIPTYRAFRAKDGVDIVITANTEGMWEGLCRSLDCMDLVTDKRFLTNRERHVNRELLAPILDRAFLERTSDEWIEILEREQVPVGVVNTLDRVMRDPQIEAREMILRLESPDGREVSVMGNPILMASQRDTQHEFPPAKGEHSAAILSEVLALGADEIHRLFAEKIIAAK